VADPAAAVETPTARRLRLRREGARRPALVPEPTPAPERYHAFDGYDMLTRKPEPEPWIEGLTCVGCSKPMPEGDRHHFHDTRCIEAWERRDRPEVTRRVDADLEAQRRKPRAVKPAPKPALTPEQRRDRKRRRDGSTGRRGPRDRRADPRDRRGAPSPSWT
jgi:hypothetical protein